MDKHLHVKGWRRTLARQQPLRALGCSCFSKHVCHRCLQGTLWYDISAVFDQALPDAECMPHV